MKRKPSERTLFERWYRQEWSGYTAAEMREFRSENGYSHATIDILWLGWQARARMGKPT